MPGAVSMAYRYVLPGDAPHSNTAIFAEHPRCVRGDQGASSGIRVPPYPYSSRYARAISSAVSSSSARVARLGPSISPPQAPSPA